MLIKSFLVRRFRRRKRRPKLRLRPRFTNIYPLRPSTLILAPRFYLQWGSESSGRSLESGFLVHRGILPGRLSKSYYISLQLVTTTQVRTQSRPRPLPFKRFFQFWRHFPAQILWFHFFSLLPPVISYDFWSYAASTFPVRHGRSKSPQTELSFYWTTIAALSKVNYELQIRGTSHLESTTYFLKYLVSYTEAWHFPKVCFMFLPYKPRVGYVGELAKLVETCVYPRLRSFHKLFFFYLDFKRNSQISTS